ncbi:hypothetical protein FDP41_011200 [Naegleria fowleri]|uniref:EF-hand domain-containing protein n=1 Tax=Naegleria fowleri TaxID=5763 RepID=A0A6A5C955_NAEFO|nr:uncharacterized protein FDP41_011200 [Naegleria fowleri]KAF0982270.1 hypothetical protein FDP41_011200 [Naegleria fowleri]CAG4709485.1 unnamed protein product [Naegleria fowleri]
MYGYNPGMPGMYVQPGTTTTTVTTYWQGPPPAWMPAGFVVPPHIMANRFNYVQAAQQIFWQYDLNRNGTLSKKEFKFAAATHFGIPPMNAKYLFRMMDRDGNGVITLDEFINAYLFIMAGGANYITPMPSFRKRMGMMGGVPYGVPPPMPYGGMPYNPYGYPPQPFN